MRVGKKGLSAALAAMTVFCGMMTFDSPQAAARWSSWDTDALRDAIHSIERGEPAPPVPPRRPNPIYAGAYSNQANARKDMSDSDKLLILSVKNGDTGSAYYALQSGAYINGVFPESYNGETPMLIALRKGNSEMVRFLLQNGADVNGFYCYDNSYTSYLVYATGESLGMVQILLDWHVNINGTSRDTSGRRDNALTATVDHYYGGDKPALMEMARVLVDAGIDINFRRADGTTPLLMAVDRGWVDMVDFLASRGADLYARDNKGRDALRIALDNNNLTLYKHINEMRPR